MLEAVLDVPYDPVQPFHTFDLYVPSQHIHAVVLCFIHGGAWRSEDKADHQQLARNLALATRMPVAVPNYRLTPKEPDSDAALRHPVHAEDILLFLNFLLTWNPSAKNPSVSYFRNIYLMGHSCSAHMLTSVFLNSSAVTPTLTPSASLLQAVKAVVISEGIYDLDKLLEDFPNYRDWFVAPAFGDRGSYAPFSTLNYRLWSSDIRWLVVHSKGDSLVNLYQSQAIYQHLQQLYGTDAQKHVQRNMDQFVAEHNDILKEDSFVDTVNAFLVVHS